MTVRTGNEEPRDVIGLRLALRDAAEAYFQTPYSIEVSDEDFQVFVIRHEGRKYHVVISATEEIRADH